MRQVSCLRTCGSAAARAAISRSRASISFLSSLSKSPIPYWTKGVMASRHLSVAVPAWCRRETWLLLGGSHTDLQERTSDNC